MSLKKYEAFVRTVELGSLTRAAEAMGSTQSRISHVLSALEEEYGFVLLRRNRSGVRLTEAGEMVLPKMQEILQKDRELTELEDMARDLFGTRAKIDGDKNRGKLVISYYSADDLQRIWEALEAARR